MPIVPKCRSLDFLGFPTYKVSDIGVVWTKNGVGNSATKVWDGNWRRLTTYPTEDGYVKYQLCCKGNRKFFLAHHLVLFAFVGPKPEGLQTRHLNDIKDDNRLENLCWGTKSENMQDAIANGIFPSRVGEKNAAAKLTEDQVMEIRRLYVPRSKRDSKVKDRKGKRNRTEYLRYSRKVLADRFGISINTIDAILSRKLWSNVA